jgi:hypothetical protein
MGEVGKKSGEKAVTSETIFKYINLVIVLVLVFCVKGFLEFREYCVQKGHYVFSTDSLIWCAVGFVGIFVSAGPLRSPSTRTGS